MNSNLIALCSLVNTIAQVHGAKIVSEIAEGLCKQLANFVATQTLPSRLQRHQNPPVLPQSWFSWTSCGGSMCIPFNIVKQKNSNTAKTQFYKNYRGQLQLSVIVELKSDPDCMGHEISTIFPTTIMCDNGAQSAGVLTKFLKNFTASAQAEVVNILESKRRLLGLTFEPLWITNQIIVSGSDVGTVKQLLGGHKDVERVRLEEVEEIIQNYPENNVSKTVSANIPAASFWGQIELKIPAIHSAGVNGSGIVVGSLDTGVDYTHPALFDNFRREYGYFDPYLGDPFPSDVLGHGTHVMGILAGQKPYGLAPGATWMTCRNCLNGICLETATKKCMQWILCPTRSNGTDPDCSKKPHVVNNSWGSSEYVEKDKPHFRYDKLIQCWRQAGIIPVFAAGNSGPKCSSLFYPGVSAQVIGVGMLAGKGRPVHVQPHSSRGPPNPYWNITIKPDFTAPGVEILSTWPDGDTAWKSGTSQAAPHVAGTIALMLQVNPTLSFDDVRNALIGSARPVRVVQTQSCGGVSENVYPNNQAGYGSINSFKAVFGTSP